MLQSIRGVVSKTQQFPVAGKTECQWENECPNGSGTLSISSSEAVNGQHRRNSIGISKWSDNRNQKRPGLRLNLPPSNCNPEWLTV
jgi:hypothetical protein